MLAGLLTERTRAGVIRARYGSEQKSHHVPLVPLRSGLDCLSHCLFPPNCIRALYDAMRAKRAAAGATLAGP
jgi:hypothetical protein